MKKLFLLLTIVITLPVYSQVWDWIGPPPANTVHTLKEYKGLLYVGGYFSLKTWNGYMWISSQMTNQAVYTMEVFDDTLYAGGAFTSIEGVPCNYLAKFDGQNWTAIGNGLTGEIRCIEKYNNDLYVGGLFSDSLSGIQNIAKWDGANWISIGEVNGIVYTMEVNNGKLYIGGTFTYAGGIVANNFAVWDGTSWSTLGSGTDESIYYLKSVDSLLYIAGYFNTFDGDSVFQFGSLYDSIVTNLGIGPLTGGLTFIYPHNDNFFLSGMFIWPTVDTFYTTMVNYNVNGWQYIGVPLMANAIFFAIEYFDGWYYVGGHFLPWHFIRFSLTTSVSEAIELPDVIISPNPAYDVLNISTSAPIVFNEITITDITGRIILKCQEEVNNRHQVNISSLPAGIYLLILENKNREQKTVRKFVKN